MKTVAAGPRFEHVDDDYSPLLEEQLTALGIELVTPGVWHLEPSVNVAGVLHAFVVLYDVPSPAPWEARLVEVP